MPSQDEPTLAEILESLNTFHGLVERVSPARRERLAPVLVRVVGHQLGVEALVLPPDDAELIRVLTQHIVEVLDKTPGDVEHLDVMDAASDLIEAVDSRNYKLVQQTGL